MGIEKLDIAARVSLAQREAVATACSGDPCPFMGTPCNKKGGVCSIRSYSQTEMAGPVSLIESPVSVCPNRFKENGMIYSWVAEKLLGTTEPLVLGEIGFLDKFRPIPRPGTVPAEPGEEEESSDFIGRIDNVLIHPDKSPMDWCALEIQAVYFSGKSMAKEFSDIGATSRSQPCAR